MPAFAGRTTKPAGSRFPDQQRQCLSRPLQWRRHKEPPELSRLAQNVGGVGRDGHAGRSDPRSDRTRAISTNPAIIAIGYPLHSSSAVGWRGSVLATMVSYLAGPTATAW